VLGGIGNGYAGACLSTLLMARTPERARGRVSAAVNAVFGGVQGVSLLVGGAVAVVLSPRAIYAVGGLLGLAAAGLLALTRPQVDDQDQFAPRSALIWSEVCQVGTA
jgi:MFS family permease